MNIYGGVQNSAVALQPCPFHIWEIYAKQGVQYDINDFMIWGRAVGIENQACYVKIDSTDKISLGPYREILLNRMITSKIIKNEEDFYIMNNRELLRKLSVCGNSPNYYISWGSKYYYCIPQMGCNINSIKFLPFCQHECTRIRSKYSPLIKGLRELLTHRR
ncbi:MAG: hypothetical protein AB1422_18970 [bacterium]